MNVARLGVCVLLVAGAVGVASLSTAQEAGDRVGLATKAWNILKANCYECHGQDPDAAKHKAKLNLRDHAALTNKDRGLVVPGKVEDSELIKRVDSDDDNERMPLKKPKLSEADRKVLRDWIAAGAPEFPKPSATTAAKPPDTERVAAPSAEAKKPEPALLAAVKGILKTNCASCHGGTRKDGGLDILDRDLLIAKKKIVPGNADVSRLIEVVVDGAMPKDARRLPESDINQLRSWISAGAPSLPRDEVADSDQKGEEYVLNAILQDIRKMDRDDRSFVRYFSVNHLLIRGTSRQELDDHYLALAKAINHLSWLPKLVRPVKIEPTGTVFRVNIRELDWHTRPFRTLNEQQQEVQARSERNLFDLVLLEYPYGILDMDSNTAQALLDEWLMAGGQAIQVRPVAYIRADWFASVATSTPLYEDLLQLPFSLEKLERLLSVDAKSNTTTTFTAARAGITNSGVSRNNRVVERHPIRFGAYWKSYDFRTSRGGENMFRDPINFAFFGGEMIFNLPNGLQAYYVCDANGKRIEAAPTEIVTDQNASDKTVRNGLACMRCHDQGMKRDFEDDVRTRVEKIRFLEEGKRADVLRLYPGTKKIKELLDEDAARFLGRMADLFEKKDRKLLDPVPEPLKPVSKRFLDDPLDLPTAASELGLKEAEQRLAGKFETDDLVGVGLYPLAQGGHIRRDAWDECFDKVVRNFRLGTPIVPIDGINMKEFEPVSKDIQVEFKTNAKLFKPGENLKISVKNTSAKPAFIELIGTLDSGTKVILLAPKQVAPGATYEHPDVPIKAGAGKAQITLYASDANFEKAELLRMAAADLATGKDVFDRVVHASFYKCEYDATRRRFTMKFDAGKNVMKKTIEIETQ